MNEKDEAAVIERVEAGLRHTGYGTRSIALENLKLLRARQASLITQRDQALAEVERLRADLRAIAKELGAEEPTRDAIFDYIGALADEALGLRAALERFLDAVNEEAGAALKELIDGDPRMAKACLDALFDDEGPYWGTLRALATNTRETP